MQQRENYLNFIGHAANLAANDNLKGKVHCITLKRIKFKTRFEVSIAEIAKKNTLIDAVNFIS